MNGKDLIKFIYIIHSFPPLKLQVGIRALEFSKRFVKENIFPIIITQKIKKKSALNYSLVKEIPASLKIYRTNFFESDNRIKFFLISNLFRLAFFLGNIPILFKKVKKKLKTKQNAKFVYASGPFFYTHMIGYLLKKKYKIPLVVEYRDPWSFNPYYDNGRRGIIEHIDLLIERKILKNADIIITVSTALSSFLKTNFPFLRNKPIISISNGLNLQNISNYDEKDPQKIIFTFTGTLYEKRNIIPLLKIISELKKDNILSGSKFKIKIYGKQYGINLEKAIKELDIEDLVYLGGLVPRDEALKEIIKSDLAIHVGENLDYPTIAFKVWDYLSCRRKILYLGREDSFTANFFKKNSFAVIIPINNLGKGKEVLKDLLDDFAQEKFNNRINEKELSEFKWDKKAKKFIEKIVNPLIKLDLTS